MWKPIVAIALGGSGVVRDFVAVQDVYIRSRVSPSGDSIHVDIVSPDLVTLETVSSGNTVSMLQSRVVW